jgi:hypothetical protein
MSETYTFTGRVIHIGDVQEFGSNGFYKRDLILSDEADKYPQEINFECAKKAADDAGDLDIGDQVEVAFDLRGREWKGRWFSSLNAWKIKVVSAGKAKAEKSKEPPITYADDQDTLDEDVPF